MKYYLDQVGKRQSWAVRVNKKYIGFVKLLDAGNFSATPTIAGAEHLIEKFPFKEEAAEYLVETAKIFKKPLTVREKILGGENIAKIKKQLGRASRPAKPDTSDIPVGRNPITDPLITLQAEWSAVAKQYTASPANSTREMNLGIKLLAIEKKIREAKLIRGRNPIKGHDDLEPCTYREREGIMFEAGYKDYTGHIFTAAEADSINRNTKEIYRSTYEPETQRLRDERHKLFVSISKRRGKNPVPKGKAASLTQAKRRYKSFRDQPVTGTVEIKAPDYMKGAKQIGHCLAIDYTTFRGEENKLEKYRHEFNDICAPVIFKSASGHLWAGGGRYRFTYRGFLDQPKAIESKAGLPPFETALVVGYLDTLYTGTDKRINFIGKKVLLCVSESGYNFFTVSEP